MHVVVRTRSDLPPYSDRFSQLWSLGSGKLDRDIKINVVNGDEKKPDNATSPIKKIPSTSSSKITSP